MGKITKKKMITSQTCSHNANWRGGLTNRNGYLCQTHTGGNQSIARLIMEEVLNRKLRPKEVVHHIDGNGMNPNIGNLMVFATHAMHIAFHHKQRAFSACGHWDWRKCCRCHNWDNPNKLYISPKGDRAYHRECNLQYKKLLRKNRLLQSPLEAEAPAVNQEEAHYRELQRRHGW